MNNPAENIDKTIYPDEQKMHEELPVDASTSTGIPFRWPANPASPTGTELDTVQSTALSTNPSTSSLDAFGASRLDFLRGARGNEGPGAFRTRSTVLGDIINSSPILVKAPEATMITASYVAFKQANTGRIPIIYVGANDGMLHGFRADTGAEVLLMCLILYLVD